MGISRTELQQNIHVFSECTDIPVTVYDKTYKVIFRTFPEKNLCCASGRPQTESSCRKAPSFAAQNAFSLGEPYIYSCDCGFIFFCVAMLTPDGQYAGCQIAGPLRMEPLTPNVIQTVMAHNPNLSTAAYSQLFHALQQMSERTPTQIESLSKLLYNNVISLCGDNGVYERNRSLSRVQNEIGRNILEYKHVQRTQNLADIAEEGAEQLASLLLEGRPDEGRELVEHILQRHISIEDGNFERIKLRLLQLYMDLCRETLERKRLFQNEITVDFPLLSSLNEIQTVEALFDWSRRMLARFQEQIASALYDGFSDWIVKAVQYIHIHYAEKLTLRELAAKLHVHESYLSKLFKQNVGMNFSDYLNSIRIEQSISLLTTTNKSILEVSSAVGFEDQSYFTKVFRKIIGETPKKYRTLKAKESADPR